jgi:hypothetical protein
MPIPVLHWINVSLLEYLHVNLSQLIILLSSNPINQNNFKNTFAFIL